MPARRRVNCILTLSVLLLLPQVVFPQEIAFTFDDAPTADGPVFSGEQRSAKILKHLSDAGVAEAAFFVITGSITPDNASRLRQYAAAGHLLANHTHTHRRIRSLGVDGYIRDINTADSILRPMPGFTPLFRYPFLDEGNTRGLRDSIRAAIASKGLANGYVTIDNYDWYINGQLKRAIEQGKSFDTTRLRKMYIDHVWESIRFYDSIAKTVLNRSPKHVLLLHENDLAALFLGDLLKHLKNEGWKFIAVSDAYRDPIASEIPDVLFNGQGRIGAIARAKGIAASRLVQESEDEAFLDKVAEGDRVFGQ